MIISKYGQRKANRENHIGVDTNGFPHAIHVTTANVNDRDGALEMLELHKSNLTRTILVVILSIDRLERNYSEIREQWQYITQTLKAI